MKTRVLTLIAIPACLLLLLTWTLAQATQVQQQEQMLSSTASLETDSLRASPLATSTAYLPITLKSFSESYPHQVTSGASNDTQPILSPDGKFIIFISDRAGQPDMFRVPVLGGEPVNITQTPARSEDTPVFSPDGQTIAYASNDTAGGDWDIFLMNPDGSNKRFGITNTLSNESHPFFSLDGQDLFFVSDIYGNWEIFRASIGSESFSWQRLTYENASDRFPVLSSNGTTLAFRSDRSGNSEIWLMDTDGSNPRPFTDHSAFDSHGAHVPDMSGIVFDSNRSGLWSSYLANPAGAGLVSLEQDSGWQMMHSNISRDGSWRVYAAAPSGGDYDLYLDHFTTPLMAIAQQGDANIGSNCNWEGGVLAYGWSLAWQSTHDYQYWEWIKAFVDRCMPYETINMVNDGLLGYAALIVYQEYPKPEYLAFAQQVANWMLNDAQRTSDGTLSHTNDGDGVWCDTMISIAPFLAEMTKVTNNDIYLDEAIDQAIKHANLLQNSLNGLYHHAWSESQNDFIGSAYWNRANGWVLAGEVAVLSTMTTTHPSYNTLKNTFSAQVAGLKPLQDNDSGLWHVIVTRSDFYLETSGTALIGYAIDKGVEEGWLDYWTYVDTAEAAIQGVWKKVRSDGIVTDVTIGTGARPNEEDYNALPHDESQLFGQGVALMSGTP